MQYRNESYAEGVFDTFWFEKNLQGDVVAIYNNAGVKLASYIYDAWGNFTVTYTNGGATTAAQYNPFTYRSYYYDDDLGLYYLNSRYYDSNTGRFINADGQLNDSLLGYNLFAYCGNNSKMANKVFSFEGVKERTSSVLSVNSGWRIYALVQNSFPVYTGWKNEWFITDYPDVFVLTNEGFELLNWGLILYRGSLYFDLDENYSLYISSGSIDTYIGINYKKGIGLDLSASAINLGYDGKIADASVDFFTIGFTLMYKDGKLQNSIGTGWIGYSLEVDIREFLKWLFGGN